MLNIIVGIISIACGVALLRNKAYKSGLWLSFLGIANTVVGVIQCK